MEPTTANFSLLQRKFEAEIAELRADWRAEQAAPAARRDESVVRQLADALRQSEQLVAQLDALAATVAHAASQRRPFTAAEADQLRYFGFRVPALPPAPTLHTRSGSAQRSQSPGYATQTASMNQLVPAFPDSHAVTAAPAGAAAQPQQRQNHIRYTEPTPLATSPNMYSGRGAFSDSGATPTFSPTSWLPGGGAVAPADPYNRASPPEAPAALPQQQGAVGSGQNDRLVQPRPLRGQSRSPGVLESQRSTASVSASPPAVAQDTTAALVEQRAVEIAALRVQALLEQERARIERDAAAAALESPEFHRAVADAAESRVDAAVARSSERFRVEIDVARSEGQREGAAAAERQADALRAELRAARAAGDGFMRDLDAARREVADLRDTLRQHTTRGAALDAVAMPRRDGRSAQFVHDVAREADAVLAQLTSAMGATRCLQQPRPQYAAVGPTAIEYPWAALSAPPPWLGLPCAATSGPPDAPVLGVPFLVEAGGAHERARALRAALEGICDADAAAEVGGAQSAAAQTGVNRSRPDLRQRRLQAAQAIAEDARAASSRALSRQAQLMTASPVPPPPVSPATHHSAAVSAPRAAPPATLAPSVASAHPAAAASGVDFSVASSHTTSPQAASSFDFTPPRAPAHLAGGSSLGRSAQHDGRGASAGLVDGQSPTVELGVLQRLQEERTQLMQELDRYRALNARGVSPLPTNSSAAADRTRHGSAGAGATRGGIGSAAVSQSSRAGSHFDASNASASDPLAAVAVGAGDRSALMMRTVRPVSPAASTRPPAAPVRLAGIGHPPTSRNVFTSSLSGAASAANSASRLSHGGATAVATVGASTTLQQQQAAMEAEAEAAAQRQLDVLLRTRPDAVRNMTRSELDVLRRVAFDQHLREIRSRAKQAGRQ